MPRGREAFFTVRDNDAVYNAYRDKQGKEKDKYLGIDFDETEEFKYNQAVDFIIVGGCGDLMNSFRHQTLYLPCMDAWVSDHKPLHATINLERASSSADTTTS